MSAKTLVFDAKKCTGCRICELTCSIEKEKKFAPRKARLRVVYQYPFNDVAVVCRHCSLAPCVKQCGVNAIERDINTDAWKVNSAKCIGCGECVEACPFGVIRVSTDDNVAVKCDLCDGKPQCVLWCPTGALTFETRVSVTQKKSERFAKQYASLLRSQRFRSDPIRSGKL